MEQMPQMPQMPVQRKKLICGAAVAAIAIASGVAIVVALLLSGSRESEANEAARPAMQPSRSPFTGVRWPQSSGTSSPQSSDVFDSNELTVGSAPGIGSTQEAQPSTLATLPPETPSETSFGIPSKAPTDKPSTDPVTASPSRTPVKQVSCHDNF